MSLEKALEELGVPRHLTALIRLGPGVVGRSSMTAVAALVVLGIIAARSPDWLLPWVLGVTAGLFALYLAGVLLFAHVNPGPALLEGAELLQWKRDDVAMKGRTISVDAPVVLDPGKALPAAPDAPLLEDAAEGER